MHHYFENKGVNLCKNVYYLGALPYLLKKAY